MRRCHGFLSAPLLILAVIAPIVGRGAPFTAYADGETFTYRVGWGIFTRAGEIVVSARREPQPNGTTAFHITTETATKGFIRGFYSYTNRAEALVDVASGHLLVIREKGSDGRRNTDSEATFDYGRRTGQYDDRAHPDRNHPFDLPPGEPQDLMTCLISTRTWNLKPGEKRDAVVYFGRDIYAITMVAEDYETVSTPMGRFRTLRMVPRMEKNPKGLFARGGDIKVWVSTGDGRLPVKMQLQLNFGSAILSLARYSAGPAPVPAPAAAPGPEKGR
jgi:hypothetical protein